MKHWKEYAPDDPEGLRAFLREMIDRTVKRGAWFVESEEDAHKIFDQVMDEMYQELKEHMSCKNASEKT